MEDDLLQLLGLTAFMFAACTVLPGLLLKGLTLFQRVRGRRADWPTLIGPIVHDELVKLARRGLQPRLRAVFAVVLLVALLATFFRQFPNRSPLQLLFSAEGSHVPIDGMAQFAQTFFQLFTLLQLLALTLLTPVFSGGSIIEEKERHTLDHLRVTLLSNREIVLGKFAARLVYVLGVAATGLPVLALTMLFGGVDGPMLICIFVTAAISTLSLAAFSLWQGTRKDSLRSVLTRTYSTLGFHFVIGLGFLGCYPPLSIISPFTYILALFGGVRPGWMNAPQEMAFNLVLLHGSAAIFLLLLAIGNVRSIVTSFTPQEAVRQPVPLPWETAPLTLDVPLPSSLAIDIEQHAKTQSHHRRERPPPRLIPVPGIDDEAPLHWKEQFFSQKHLSHTEQGYRGCGLALLWLVLLPMGIGLVVSVVQLVAVGERPGQKLHPIFQTVTTLAVALIVPIMAIRGAGIVSRERQKQTLDSLLMLPVERSQILRAKRWAIIRPLQPWLIGLGGFALLCGLTLAVDLVGLAFLFMLVPATLGFYANLVIWLSVRCVTSTRAIAWGVTLALVVTVLPVILGMLGGALVQNTATSPRFVMETLSTISPPIAAHRMAIPWHGTDRGHDATSELLGGSLSILLLLAGAGLFRWHAVRCFENEGRC